MMDGVINIYKPKGITSFDAVYKIKKLLNTGKVGHAGTLDPMATGVLPVCVGKATKIIDYIMRNEKTYGVSLKLGIVTDTYDLEGKIIEEKECLSISDSLILDTINSFVGIQKQIPPMYSAIKVNGKKLYELARKGITIEREAREITIYSIDNILINKPSISFDVKCSKGTYIRSLCYDIGNKLNCGATMTELTRKNNGSFSIEDSINIDELNNDNISNFIIPMERALGSYKKFIIEDKFCNLLINGVCIADPQLLNKVIDDNIYRVFSKEDELIGLGQKNIKGFKLLKLLI